MPNTSPKQITQLLLDWSNGDQAALDNLIPLVYEELRRLARRYMRNERPGHTLQTTDLVNEAYLRLTDYKRVQWQERAHFFAIAAQIMRRLLVEHARSRQRIKRGANRQRVSFDERIILLPDSSPDSEERFLNVLAVDEALTKLEADYPRKSRVVEMRFFGGMENEEIANVLKIAPNTVTRDWNFAEAWLRRELGV